MKIAFTTLGCPDWSLQQAVERAHQWSYDGIELRFIAGNMDLLNTPELTVDRAQTLSRLRAMQLDLCCLDSSVRFDDPSETTRAEQLQMGMRYVDLAREMGVRFVRVFGDTFAKSESPSQVVDWVSAGLQRLGAHAEGKDVSVLLESHGDFSRADLLGEVMQRVDSLHVGILWDVHHPWRLRAEQAQTTVQQIGRWIRHTHWKDSVQSDDHGRGYPVPQATPALRAQRAAQGYRYVLFGAGELPAREFIAALRSIQYDGWLALEWEKKWHPSIEEPEVAFPQFIEQMRALLAE